ncbi:MAG: hypothetical protein R2942_00720 [Ignavibacteria bacterium]
MNQKIQCKLILRKTALTVSALTVKIQKDNLREIILIKVITSKEVKNHIGDSLVIRGLVADVYVSEKVSYLNFENRFPKNVFACAIFSSKTDAFGDLSKYKGKLVEVNGKISTFKNKPQVILNSPDQIKILK